MRRAPGWRFFPTPYELVRFYLYPKVRSLSFDPSVVTDVELYNYHPAELAKLHKDKGEKAWYFFTRREQVHTNGPLPNRAVKENMEGQGYWEAVGEDIAVKDPRTKAAIALKKKLIYHEGKPGQGVETNWIMKEYRLLKRQRDAASSTEGQSRSVKLIDKRSEDWVLCKIRQISQRNKKRKNEEQERTNDAGKQCRVEKDATEKRCRRDDQEVSMFIEDGNGEFLEEGQAVSSNSMTIPKDGLPDTRFEPVHSSDLTNAVAALQITQSDATTNPTIKVEDFTNICEAISTTSGRITAESGNGRLTMEWKSSACQLPIHPH